MLHGLLSFRGDTPCYLCKKKHVENLDHLLFHCPFLTRCRDLVRGWLGQLGVQTFNKHNIIEMTRVNPGFENYCISLYKDTIWKSRNIDKTSKNVSVVPTYNTLERSAVFISNLSSNPKVYLLHGRTHSTTALLQWNIYDYNKKPDSVLNIQCVFIIARGKWWQVPSQEVCIEWDTIINKKIYIKKNILKKMFDLIASWPFG